MVDLAFWAMLQFSLVMDLTSWAGLQFQACGRLNFVSQAYISSHQAFGELNFESQASISSPQACVELNFVDLLEVVQIVFPLRLGRDFGSKGQQVIYLSLLRQNRKRTLGKPRATCNSTTMNREFRPSKYAGAEEPFITLDIQMRKEIYLAAFLSCWICKFLLLGKMIGYIYTSVFKVAIQIFVKIFLVILEASSYFQTLEDILELWESSARLDTKSKVVKVKLPSSTRTLPAIGVGSSSKALEKTSTLTIPEANPPYNTANPIMTATGSQSSNTDADRDDHSNRRTSKKKNTFEIMSLGGFLEGVHSSNMSPRDLAVHKVRSFDASRSATCDMMIKEAYLESLSEVRRQLKDIASKEQAITSSFNDSQVELSSIKDKQNELQKELHMLEKHKKEDYASIWQYKKELKKVHKKSWSKKEDIAAMENVPFQSDKVVKNLEPLREILAASRQELINYRLVI
ncbi:hypothetical protein M9H77_07661 [Catharanthus roseus]|uniref:Uncharacterized protein n=1 Tax=Catharanthus roseus TaxID=4058 RepID=A0ACC0BVM0_CATRO|nr:hypothetical protein M9H77_07661 [Catharanthus roseus]